MKKIVEKVLGAIPELPDNYVVIVTGPALTYKKKLIGALEKEGFVQLPTFTTKPKTYEDEGYYIRVKEEKWDEQIKENFICKTVINGYKYAVNWSAFHGLLKTKRPVVVGLDSAGVLEFLSKMPPTMKGYCIVNVLCRNRDVLNLRLAEYARSYKELTAEHVHHLAYHLLDAHLHYEEIESSFKLVLLHENNKESVAEVIREQITAAYLAGTPELGVEKNVKLN